jgi:hypothetical protein
MAEGPVSITAFSREPLRLQQLDKCVLPGGGAVYTMYCPPGAGPNSLGAISRFLELKGCHLQPEFADNPDEPVLRIGMLRHADKLEGWLKNEFPDWQEDNLWPGEHRLEIGKDLNIEKLETREAEFVRGIGPWDSLRKRFGHRAGPVAGSAFTVGNVMMLVSAFSSGPGGKMDAARVVSALTYIASSAIVTANSSEPAESRPLEEVVKDAIGKVEDHEAQRLLHDKLPVLTPWFERIQHAVKNHPWEVKALMDSFAGASMFYGAMKSGKPMTAASAAIGMSAILVQLTPPRFRSSLIDLQWLKDTLDNRGIISKWKETRAQNPGVQRIWEKVKNGFHWLQENNVGVAGMLGAISSIGYMISGLFGKAGKGDAGLSASGLMFLTGNVMQSLATQKTGFSLGDVTFAAAHALQQKGESMDTSRPLTREHVHHTAMALTAQPEIHQQPSRISQGMEVMMDIMRTEDRLSLLKPDGYLTSMNWNAQRKSEFVVHPFVPRTAALEEAARAQGLVA